MEHARDYAGFPASELPEVVSTADQFAWALPEPVPSTPGAAPFSASNHDYPSSSHSRLNDDCGHSTGPKFLSLVWCSPNMAAPSEQCWSTEHHQSFDPRPFDDIKSLLAFLDSCPQVERGLVGCWTCYQAHRTLPRSQSRTKKFFSKFLSKSKKRPETAPTPTESAQEEPPAPTQPYREPAVELDIHSPTRWQGPAHIRERPPMPGNPTVYARSNNPLTSANFARVAPTPARQTVLAELCGSEPVSPISPMQHDLPRPRPPNPVASPTAVSEMSYNGSIRTGRGSLVSQPSVSSSRDLSLFPPSRLNTSSPRITDEPLCSSPSSFEDDADNFDLPPWRRDSPVEKKGSWDSTTTAVGSLNDPSGRLPSAPAAWNVTHTPEPAKDVQPFTGRWDDAASKPQPVATYDAGSDTGKERALPPPVWPIPSGPSCYAQGKDEILDGVRGQLCKNLTTDFGMGDLAEAFRGASSTHVLLGGIYELKAQRGGCQSDQGIDMDINKLCFAHLALAMGQCVPNVPTSNLHIDLRRFLVTQGSRGLSRRFKEAADVFLLTLGRHLQMQVGSSDIERVMRPALSSRLLTPLSDDALREVALTHVQEYFERQINAEANHPPRPSEEYRQNSWSSTSTDATLSSSDTIRPSSMPDSPEQARLEERNLAVTPRSSPTKKRQRHSPGANKAMGCSQCGQYFTEGPDFGKCVKRHEKSRKHIEISQRMSGEKLEAVSVIRFPCHFVEPDGTVCQKDYNREDNLKSHQRDAHRCFPEESTRDEVADDVEAPAGIKRERRAKRQRNR